MRRSIAASTFSLDGAEGVILKSKTVSATDGLHHSLNLPTGVVIIGIDSPKVLDQAFEAARSFHPMG